MERRTYMLVTTPVILGDSREEPTSAAEFTSGDPNCPETPSHSITDGLGIRVSGDYTLNHSGHTFLL